LNRPQEFNKKFRGSDDFKASVAEDKIESFGKVLQKFFDTEREDYKKDAAAKIPDYDYLVKKAGQAWIKSRVCHGGLCRKDMSGHVVKSCTFLDGVHVKFGPVYCHMPGFLL